MHKGTTLLYEQTLKSSTVDEKTDEKESNEMKQFYNQYLDKWKKKEWRISSFKVEDVFGDIGSKDNISQDQISKPKNFLAKITWI